MKPNKSKNSSTAEKAFFKALSVLSTPSEAEHFFRDLCTPAELQAMVDRWRVVPMLIEGKPYRAIQEETGVSVTTVGRVARSLNMGEGGYKVVFEKLKKS